MPDVYGNPTQIIISCPALNFNKTLDLKKDGVLFINDSMKMGLWKHFNKYNTLMVENDINLVIHGYNSRNQKLISASDDKTKASAELYMQKLVDGELSVIGENAMFEGVRVQSGGSTSSDATRGMLEYHQYLRGTMYNEIGLGQNFNMKKERLVSAEIDQIRDSIFPLVYDMMKCRIKSVEKLNEMYDMDLKIGFGSVWNVVLKDFVDDVVEEEEHVEGVGGDIVPGVETDVDDTTPAVSDDGGASGEETPVGDVEDVEEVPAETGEQKELELVQESPSVEDIAEEEREESEDEKRELTKEVEDEVE